MTSSHSMLRGVLLGSALALALAPAFAATVSHNDSHRMRALHGNRASAQQKAAAHSSAQPGRGFNTIYSFAGSGDGSSPETDVRMDGAGNIYGVTDYGGANGAGAIYKIASDGTETLLHSFGGSGDGSYPDAGVTINQSTGDLYGTTESGGSSGNGVIYELAADGTYTVLHSFDGTNDGSFPRGRLIRDTLGNFYGAALFGGANDDGTVFKYGYDGSFTVLHAFNGTDGEFPEHSVIRDRAGNLYGVTAFGGTSDEGTVYKVGSDGSFSSLYSFTGGADGGFPYGGLDRDNQNNLYGSTDDGGTNGVGTVFKLTPGGTESVLYSFTGGTDGGSPEGDMLFTGNGVVSTAYSGGDPSCQCGVVYKVNLDGKEKTLYAFTGGSDGSYPEAGLYRNGKTFYGTASAGGSSGNGTVFSLTKK